MNDRELKANQILEFLISTPRQTAREISRALGFEKKEVNSILYSELKNQCSIDNEYRWSPNNSKSKKNNDFSIQTTDITDFDKNNPLSKLCSYYLSCLSLEDDGISVFADSNFDLDYHEIDSFSRIQNGRNFFHPDLKKLIDKTKKNSSKKELYFGYPSSVKKIFSRKSNWQGMIVAPIILYPVINDGDGLKVNFNMPFFNLSVIKDLSKVDREDLINELLLLEEKLGFSNSNNIPEIDDMISLLKDFRSEWPWQEEPDPYNLNSDPPLKDIHEEGIYNRGVFLAVDRSPYTQGLESELSQLSHLSLASIQGSALASWISDDVDDSVEDDSDLIEVLPMNLEQRLAVKSALNSKLTVVTGPPGTGKSQVVTNILMNAAWRGKKILFASKNNQAVDVVDTRVNSLGSRPILLRLGTGKYMSSLAEYLLDIMSYKVSADDKENFRFYLEKHEEIEKKFSEIIKYQESIVALRNTLDEKDRKSSILREIYSNEQINEIKNIDIKKFKEDISSLKRAIIAADRNKNNFLFKLLWLAIKSNKISSLHQALEKFYPIANKLNLSLPENTDESLDSFYTFLTSLEKVVASYDILTDYDKSYQELISKKSLEDLSKDIMQLLSIKSSNEQALWSYWVKIQSEKISDKIRSQLGNYVALLKMVISAGDDIYSKLGKNFYQQYLSLSEKMSTLLPAFAITSLSARGRLPFIDSFFDIVIFDEASQCDIASALPLLLRAKQAVVIGDAKQLSHISSIRIERDQKLLERFGLINDYLKWSYSTTSLFDLATSLVKSNNIINLKDHHRSHADIIEFSNREFYGESLRVATKYDQLKLVNNRGGIRWVDISGKSYRPNAGGAVNEIEAMQIVKELETLVFNQKYSGSLGVVTPFREQANLIRRLISNNNTLETELTRHDFLVDTVHKFQGDERDVMLFSSVVSNGMPPSALSFLRNSGNLFNVAITRARAQLIVVGDRTAMANCDIKYYKDFAVYVSNLENKKKEADSDILQNLGPQYPIVAKPELVSDWEKYFYEEAYKAGLRLIPQYNLEKYILDFALFDNERKLDIEIDGEHYHKSWNGELCYRDQLRNQRIFELGWDVKRFWVYEVRDDIEGCINKIKDWL